MAHYGTIIDNLLDKYAVTGVRADTAYLQTVSDINGDRIVDGLDVIQITTRFAAGILDPVYLAGADFDGDGMIDGDDLALVAADFGLECP